MGPNDLPSVVAPYQFDGQNYLQYILRILILRILKEQSRSYHINVAGPGSSDDPNFEIWDNEDS